MSRARLSLTATLALALLAWFFGRAPQPSGPAAAPPNSSLTRSRARPGPSAGNALPPGNVGSRGAPGATRTPNAAAFESAAGCAALVAAGQRLARPAQSARFASWNLHWFPDGKPGKRGAGADIAWLACALWWLDVDVIAVQEVKQTPAAQQALTELLRALNALTGARYVARLDDCGSRVPQHVGLLWNEARVAASEIETMAALNPSGRPCEQQWRPGLAGRFRLPGGLDLTAVSAHFKSMADPRSLELRARSFNAIPGMLRAVEQRTRDADLLLLGDLNTMGCDECSPPVSALEEQANVQRLLSSRGLRLLPADALGTHFHDARPTLLDHAVASRGMRELSPTARTHVAGACAGEAPKGRAAKQVRRLLSDHCPIVVDLSDRDLD